MAKRGCAAIAAGLAVASAVGSLSGCATAGGAAGDSQAGGVAVSTAPVVRTDVSQSQEVTGSLGYAGTDTVLASGPGTVTWLPPVGRVIRRGEAAYEIGGVPVPLMYGGRPAWRALQLGVTHGRDVLALNRNLAALGYAHGLGLVVNEMFSSATYWAVRRWQTAAGLPVTGTVPLGQVVFQSGAVRVGGWDVTRGAVIQPGQEIEYGTGATRAVVVQLNPAVLPKVRAGDPVTVTMPNGTTRPGKVTAVGAVAVPQSSSSGSTSSSPASSSSSPGSAPEAPVTIAVHGPAGGWLDQAQVQVAITSQEEKNVLAVPTVALLAAPGGRYQVIVVDGAARHRVIVQPGLFDENTGLTQVTGALSPGQRVEVPHGSA